MHLPLSLVRAWAANLWSARVRGRTYLRPLGVTWHATDICNLCCSYCDDGRGFRYPEIRRRAMSTDEAKQVLGLARQVVTALYITGGEPLLRPDLAEIVRWAKEEAGFSLVGLATNGTRLDRQPSLLGYLDQIEISLDSLNHEWYDAVLHAAPGTSNAIQEAVIRVHGEAATHGYSFSVTCVAMAGFIDHARDVFRFCLERGIRCSILPQSLGPYPVPALRTDAAYRALVDEMTAAKRHGAAVYGSDSYYAHIRDFRAFRCYPTLAPRILPNGDLCYPCAPLGTIAGNLIGARSFSEILAAGLAAHGPVPACDARCFASCYIEPANFITAPAAMLGEYARAGRRTPRGKPRR
jgi:MoaA/NifB/PqqE/SkfB family radical SAM enzyme